VVAKEIKKKWQPVRFLVDHEGWNIEGYIIKVIESGMEVQAQQTRQLPDQLSQEQIKINH